MARTVGERLASTRRAGLVGREAELATLRAFVADPDQLFAYVHGPGGVGKSAILDALAVDAAAVDRQVVWLDCADCEPTVAGFLRALGNRAGVKDLGRLPDATLLVVDRLELLGDLALWLWPSFVGSLPEGAQVVVAGRAAPPTVWTDDPAFARHGLSLPVRNLAAVDARRLARSRGLFDEEAVTALVRASHGHPLAIVVGCDADAPPGRESTAKGVLLDHPDAVARLLGRFLDEQINEQQRAALHVCGHTRRVDRNLLARVLAVDEATADDLLAWLRDRPYAESHEDGLTLHDLVRDALDRDLRWRDRSAFGDLHRRIREVVLDRMAGAVGVEHDRCSRDLLHLHRGNPEAVQLFGLDSPDAVVARPLHAGDRDEVAWVLDLFAAQGFSGAAAYWLGREPGCVNVLEDGTGTRFGAELTVRLDRADAKLAGHDPVASHALEALGRIRPPEPDETVLRTVVADGARPGLIGPVADRMAALSFEAWRRRGVGWVVLTAEDEERWAPLWTYIGFERLGDALVGGTEWAIWARDFLRSPFADWLALLEASELDENGAAPRPVAAPVALAREDFAEAVRRLLKDLHRRDAVRRNPLVESQLARTGDDPVVALTSRVRQGVDRLASTPKLGVAARALDRTFLRAAATQEKAAEVLGLPFSTYRRHLATGIERLEALLWDWELHGPPPPRDSLD